MDGGEISIHHSITAIIFYYMDAHIEILPIFKNVFTVHTRAAKLFEMNNRNSAKHAILMHMLYGKQGTVNSSKSPPKGRGCSHAKTTNMPQTRDTVRKLTEQKV